MTVVKVVEDVAFGAHWPRQPMGRGLRAKPRADGSPRASRGLSRQPSVVRTKKGAVFRTVLLQGARARGFRSDPGRARPHRGQPRRPAHEGTRRRGLPPPPQFPHECPVIDASFLSEGGVGPRGVAVLVRFVRPPQ